MIKKRLFLLPLIILFFSACFSPWQGDEGTLTLQLGPGNSGRLAVDENERNSLSYTVTLTGPGPGITQTFSGTTRATFSLQPGTWNVTVKGRGSRPPVYDDFFEDSVMLRAYGEKMVTVRGGGSVSEAITMFPAVEAANQSQLFGAFNNANTAEKKEIVFITKNIVLNSYIEILDGHNIELRAEKNVTIERYSDAEADIPLFFILAGGTLTLGKEGETHDYLKISGDIGGDDQYGAPYATAPLIKVGGTLVMHDAEINHNRVNVSDTYTSPVPGVLVTGLEAKFDMYGGLIDGNSGSPRGGGVAVENGGTFTMNGGSIEGNQAVEGGGVMVDNGTFIMDGGYIKINKAANVNNYGEGGGVYVANEGAFKLNSGYIEGNESAGYGGQVYVGDNGVFHMNGGTLSKKGRTAEYQAKLGAGVYITSDGGPFTKTGGTIYGSGTGENNLHASESGHAVYYYLSAAPRTRNTTLEDGDDLSTTDITETSNWDLP